MLTKLWRLMKQMAKWSFALIKISRSLEGVGGNCDIWELTEFLASVS
jgi:hypothetical protein